MDFLTLIPFEEYEKDIDNGPGKENKQEILNLFQNSNLHSIEEFDEIKSKLHEACRLGDLELINILLQETINNESNEFTFKIDKTNQTASLFKVNNDHIDEFTIPRKFKHESTEYLITSICGIGNKKVKRMKFSEDSAVETIFGFIFPSSSQITEIYFPASLKELKEGWCCDTDFMTKILISPLNSQFIFKDKKYLIGKSDSSNYEFDKLLFVRRDIKNFSIPSNIKIISSFAFYDCQNLEEVVILPNSNLEIIGSNSFSHSNIKNFSIPSNVKIISSRAFYNCKNLTQFSIPSDSKLQIIESYAFSYSKINEISFPESLKELKGGWCHGVNNLTKILISQSNDQFIFKDKKYLIGKSDSNNDEFDNLLFVRRDIKNFSIPSNIKIISSCALYDCQNLKKVKIPLNSNLKIIESNAFYNTSINKIFIPSKISKICEYAFYNCRNLEKVKMPPNSNLEIIERFAFYNTGINKIFIPSKISKICEYTFYNCQNLVKVEIPYISNLEIIERFAFYNTGINEIFIPSKISKICQFAFSCCQNLRIVRISPNSNLETIETGAFSYSEIEEIYYPTTISEICVNEYTFSNSKHPVKRNKFFIYNNFENELFDCQNSFSGYGINSFSKYSTSIKKKSLIKKGDFGEIYTAFNKEKRSLLVAKILYMNFNDYSEKEKLNIMNDLSIILQLYHPAICNPIGVSVYGFDEETRPTIFSEYIANGSLYDMIESGLMKNLNDTQKLINIYGIAQGMSYLHSHDILHNNLNTKNILLDNKFCPKINNCCISNSFKSIQSIKKVFKHSPFNAPEMFTQNEYTKASEVYSFGLIVYSIFSNKHPYENCSQYDIYLKIIKGEYPELDKSIPRSYINLIEKCLSSKPDERPTFQQIVDEIENNLTFITESVDVNKFYNYIKNTKLFPANYSKIESCPKTIIKKWIKLGKQKRNASSNSPKKKKENSSENQMNNNDNDNDNDDDNDDDNDEKNKIRHKKYDEEEEEEEEFEEEEEEEFEEDEEEEFEENDKNIFFPLNIKKVSLVNLVEICQIGRGGCSKVYKVKKNKHNFKYAAKVVNTKITDKSFIVEVKCHYMAKHLAITRFVGYNPKYLRNIDRPTIFTKYIINGNLGSNLEKKKKRKIILNDTNKLIIIYGIASSMSYLHSIKILHRDLNPNNVLLNKYLFPKLCDFGFAKLTQEQNDEDDNNEGAFGTKGFIAPEIYKDNCYSEASDVYAFAIFVYMLLSENDPFKKLRDQNVMYRTFSNVKPEFGESINECYKPLINKCWSGSISERPKFTEIVKELEEEEKYITENVDQKAFHHYINYIKNHKKIPSKILKKYLKK